MSDSTKCMPDDGAVQRIASHDPANLYTSGARTKAMAVEILRLRSELEKAQAEVKRLEGERDKLQDAKVEGWQVTAPRYFAVSLPYEWPWMVLLIRVDIDGRPFSQEVCTVRGDDPKAMAERIAAALNAYNQQEQETKT